MRHAEDDVALIHPRDSGEPEKWHFGDFARERRFKGTSVQIGNVKVARNMVNMSTAECLRNEDDNIEWFVAAGRNIAIRNGTWEDYEIERLFKIFRATRARLYDERKERRIKNTGQIEQVAHYD